MMQHYISLLLKHRRLVLSGPSGTGKSYLATHLAEYLVDRSAREVTDGIVVTFNMHRQSCKVKTEQRLPVNLLWISSFCDLFSPCCLFNVSSLRICSFICPTWPIRLTGTSARRTYRWLSSWMIFTTRLPSVNLSTVLSLANITNGKFILQQLTAAAKMFSRSRGHQPAHQGCLLFQPTASKVVELRTFIWLASDSK